jgi:hypothetical protein
MAGKRSVEVVFPVDTVTAAFRDREGYGSRLLAGSR